MFALRLPGLEPTYDRRIESIQSLFADIVLDRPLADEAADIFVRPIQGSPEEPFLRRPMIPFGE